MILQAPYKCHHARIRTFVRFVSIHRPPSFSSCHLPLPLRQFSNFDDDAKKDPHCGVLIHINIQIHWPLMFSSLSKHGSEDDLQPIPQRRPVRRPAFRPNSIPEDPVSLALDIGSGLCKCGFAGDDAPRAVFPTIVGRPKNPNIMVGMDAKDCFVGDEAQCKRGILNMKSPIERGRIIDIVDLEKVYHHIFYNELRIDPKEVLCCFADPTDIPRSTREKIVEIMFETFGIVGMHSSSASSCVMYASGKTSGCVVGSGDGVSSAACVYEGSRLNFERSDIGGRDITNYLVRLLDGKGYSMTTSVEKELVRDIKEKHCFVSLDFHEDWLQYEAVGPKGEEVLYELPDGSSMRVADDVRFGASEILFDPSLIPEEMHLDSDRPIDEIVVKAIKSIDVDVRKDAIRHVCCAGGSTMFQGFPERLDKALRMRLRQDPVEGCSLSDLKVVAPAERKFSSWIGASILASLTTMGEFWITGDQYRDSGPSIIHRCFL